MCILVGNLLLALISRIPWQPIDELEDIQYTAVVYLRKIRKTIKFFLFRLVVIHRIMYVFVEYFVYVVSGF